MILLPLLIGGVVGQELHSHEPVAVGGGSGDVPGAVLRESGGVGDVDGAEGALGELPAFVYLFTFMLVFVYFLVYVLLPAEAEAGAGQGGNHVRLEAPPHRPQGVGVRHQAA